MCSEFLSPMFVQFSPASLERYTPSPIDTLLRIHDSPVPTQMTLGFFGSIVTAPIDWTGCLSKTGLNVERDVGLDFVVRDFPTVRAAAALRPRLGGEWQVHAVDLLVVAERSLELLGRAADHALRVDSDGDVVLGIQIVEADVAVRACDLEFVGVAPFDLLDALILDAVAFRVIVHERAITVSTVENDLLLFITQSIWFTLVF